MIDVAEFRLLHGRLNQQGNSTLRIVNLPGAGTHGEMHMHLLTRNRRPRALLEASGIAFRCGPTFNFRTLFLFVSPSSCPALAC
jgi:hypothetical protein